ncbi:MAG: HAMP domain-containing protein [Caldilineaceae bacterium]|nr:HAMP domain-containing protein [Caldilineaceae bacterium]MBP8107685.1 HAMP domain-containing protein [Caldilineaceae bacterium]MBP8122893.1 HAMP domain-containing protein [Caldilineaceae bacterium]MBP9072280.1 HAMP domain-containing protein [Caldilineaceae bacterium]
MTGRLWFKLMSAFVLVIAVGILVTVWVAGRSAATQFSHVMINGRSLDLAALVTTLADAHTQAGGWQGADIALDDAVGSTLTGGMGNGMSGMMGRGMMGEARLLVADETGQVVADSNGRPGGRVTAATLAQGVPIQVDGARVGTLLVDGPVMTMAGIVDPAILASVTQAVWLAGVVAGAVALLLAGLLVTQITRPLAALSEAARRIAQGDRSVCVPVGRRDELGELAAAFNHMSVSLQAQEEQRRVLMADVAHELRTPLAGIQGTVEALQDGIFPLTQENLVPIQEQTALLARLVEDLRTLANAEAGQIRLDPGPVDGAKLAQRVVTMHHARATARNVTVTLIAANFLPTLHADAQRLEQVMNNLLGNALRHTPAGGTVEVRLEPTPQGMRVAVLDSGEGIPPADLPHIFERFYRSDRSRSRETGGTGLGLAIARQLVTLHGGRIWAESPPAGRAQGSGFFVELPGTAKTG